MDTIDHLVQLEDTLTAKRNNNNSNEAKQTKKRPHPSSSSTTDLETLERELNILRDITGILIEEAESSELERGDDFIRKRHRLRGSCHDLQFQATYEMMFPNNSTEDSNQIDKYEISNLKLMVEDDTATRDLDKTLLRLEKSNSLAQFFGTLCHYQHLYSMRSVMFDDLQEKYSHCVKILTAEIFTIGHPSRKGIQGAVRWRIEVSEDGEMKQDVSLQLDSSSSDKEKSIIADAPDRFKELQNMLGTAQAIHTLVQIICCHDGNPETDQ